jgi:hypothetical protein
MPLDLRIVLTSLILLLRILADLGHILPKVSILESYSVATMKQRIITVKNFLEYHDVDISPRKFKLKIKLPKSIRKWSAALSLRKICTVK